jgi:hypothetical protein
VIFKSKITHYKNDVNTAAVARGCALLSAAGGFNIMPVSWAFERRDGK